MADVSTVFHVEHRGSVARLNRQRPLKIRSHTFHVQYSHIKDEPLVLGPRGSPISLLAQRSMWNVSSQRSRISAPLADPKARDNFIPLTVNSVANSPAHRSIPVVLSHWCRNLALDQRGSLSPSSRTRLLDSGIWSGSDQRNTFPT